MEDPLLWRAVGNFLLGHRKMSLGWSRLALNALVVIAKKVTPMNSKAVRCGLSLKIRIGRGGVLHCPVTRQGAAVCSWNASERKIVIVRPFYRCCRWPQTMSAGLDASLETLPSANLARGLPAESSSSCKASLCCHHKHGPIPWFLVIITEPFNSTFYIMFTWSCKKLQKKKV